MEHLHHAAHGVLVTTGTGAHNSLLFVVHAYMAQAQRCPRCSRVQQVVHSSCRRRAAVRVSVGWLCSVCAQPMRSRVLMSFPVCRLQGEQRWGLFRARAPQAPMSNGAHANGAHANGLANGGARLPAAAKLTNGHACSKSAASEMVHKPLANGHASGVANEHCNGVNGHAKGVA